MKEPEQFERGANRAPLFFEKSFNSQRRGASSRLVVFQPRMLWLYWKIIRRMKLSWNPFLYLKMIAIYISSRLQRMMGVTKLWHPPTNLVVFSTSRCNKDCDFCHYHEDLNKPRWKDEELSFQQFVEILDSDQTPGVGRVSFLGGEPLLNQDIFKCINEAKSRKYFTSIITNGLLIEKRLDELLSSGLDLITLSYYPEDRENIEKVVPLIKEYFPVNLSFVLKNNELEKLVEVMSFAEREGLPMVTIEHVIEYNFSPHKASNDREAFEKLKRDIIARYGKNIILRWSDLFDEPPKNARISCNYFWDSIFVNATGKTSPCCNFTLDSYQGNIYKNREGLNSHRMQALRSSILAGEPPKGCEGCHYLYAKDCMYRAQKSS